jgi:phosphatidylserine decarboxylase
MAKKSNKIDLAYLQALPQHCSIEVITELFLYVEANPEFKKLLEESLKKASKMAQTPPTDLDPALYAALKWPQDFAEYLEYLIWFAHLTPKQGNNPVWADPGSPVGEHQEVYDHLCHFYYLIDQPVGPDGQIIVENLPWFSNWLVRYAKAWGCYLDTPESFNDRTLQSFINNSPMYRVEDSMINGKPNNPSGWMSFNQFFARELNPGLRPIDAPDDNSVVVSPADCTFRAFYSIDGNSEIPQIRIKGTHSFASIPQLLEGSQYAHSFANGTFVHYFLGPYSYHRFHTPVAGIVRESYAIQGKVYLEVNVQDGQFDAPDNSEGGYEFNQARGVITIDTAGSPYGDVGVIAVIPIGMAQVSSVNMIAVPGTSVGKGEEFGYFLFGGSDIIVLFQEGAVPSLVPQSTYLHYGNAIAHCLGVED